MSVGCLVSQQGCLVAATPCTYMFSADCCIPLSARVPIYACMHLSLLFSCWWLCVPMASSPSKVCCWTRVELRVAGGWLSGWVGRAVVVGHILETHRPPALACRCRPIMQLLLCHSSSGVYQSQWGPWLFTPAHISHITTHTHTGNNSPVHAMLCLAARGSLLCVFLCVSGTANHLWWCVLAVMVLPGVVVLLQ